MRTKFLVILARGRHTKLQGKWAREAEEVSHKRNSSMLRASIILVVTGTELSKLVSITEHLSSSKAVATRTTLAGLSTIVNNRNTREPISRVNGST